MLEIKTITENLPHHFDRVVNTAIADGWDLVRRECFITGSDQATTFYAELERVADDPVEEGDDAYDTARWERARDPRNPYRCSSCGHKTNAEWGTCPGCGRVMVEVKG